MNNRKQLIAAGTLAAVISLAAFFVVLHSGTLLYYGDAVSHLNIGRKILDNKTPGWQQLGTVWLPLPHLLTALTAWYDPLWTSGAAGAFPSMAGFVIGAIFLFRIARRELESQELAWAALALYLVNLNLLYLQSTPMNEAQMIGALLACVWYAGEGRPTAAALWLIAGTLTRYDGWFYIPFITLYFWRAHSLRAAVKFGAIVSLGPLFWLVHNQLLYGNALEWYNGPYAPAAIEARSGVSSSSLGSRHPGDHNLLVALQYYWKATRQVIGNVPAWCALAGALVIVWRKREVSPALLLWLPLVFYTASIAYGSAPIFIYQWYPFSYYNIRYAIELLPAIALCAPAVVLVLRRSGEFSERLWMTRLAFFLVAFVTIGWINGFTRGRSDAVVVLKEAEVNSVERRYLIGVLKTRLQDGCHEIWMGGGDWTGALVAADIPYRRIVHEGNRQAWRLVTQHPELMVDCVIAQKGDAIDQAIAKLPNFERSFRTTLDFSSPGEARLRMWRLIKLK